VRATRGAPDALQRKTAPHHQKWRVNRKLAPRLGHDRAATTLVATDRYPGHLDRSCVLRHASWSMAAARQSREFDYDVCLSFAGEDRSYVRKVADHLKDAGIRVFYDEYAEVELWGKDLFVHLDQVYSDSARFCVIFISKHYAIKLWTNHERQSAQARAFKEHQEYLLPARFDRTEVPGLRQTVGYIDLSKRSPEALAGLIAKKIGPRQRTNYLPPEPDRLFKELKVRSKKAQRAVYNVAHEFLRALHRMNETERHLVIEAFSSGCTAELPDNMHVSIDLLRRLTGVSPARMKKTFGQLRSLGIKAVVREADEDHQDPAELGHQEMLVVTWDSLMDGDDELYVNGTAVAQAMVYLVRSVFCSVCGSAAFKRLDFGQLATATFEGEQHG
jgi:hypothetical protein